MSHSNRKAAPHVLIVDDEEPVRQSGAGLFAALGFATWEAANSAEAITCLENRPNIDLLFTDVRMPGDMDGAELAFTVRSRWPRIAIIVVSAYFDPKSSRLPINTSFLAKPYRIEALKEVIRQSMNGKLKV